jgi:predicted GH43/DUF377 family glycosyl hydrolase
MAWLKNGRVWAESHAQIPVVQDLGERFRVFFSDRDTENRSFIRQVELKADNPKEILSVAPQPVLEHSEDGFDQRGAMTASITDIGGRHILYYTGWGLSDYAPYQHSIGVSISKDGVTFERLKEPVVRSTKKESYICSSPFVMLDGVYRMWYISGKDCGWVTLDGARVPIYKMAYAESNDGFDWKTKEMVFPRLSDMEIFARPFVIKDKKYRMWTTYMEMKNPKRYRVGYAESNDGIEWERLDGNAGLITSLMGWDSEMVAFPYIVRDYMFYSGNGFGKEGFGYATRV